MKLLPGDHLMSIPDAARVLNCSRAQAYVYCSRGYEGRRLETVRVGGRMKTSYAAINEFLGCDDETIATDAPDLFGLWTEDSNGDDEAKEKTAA